MYSFCYFFENYFPNLYRLHRPYENRAQHTASHLNTIVLVIYYISFDASFYFVRQILFGAREKSRQVEYGCSGRSQRTPPRLYIFGLVTAVVGFLIIRTRPPHSDSGESKSKTDYLPSISATVFVSQTPPCPGQHVDVQKDGFEFYRPADNKSYGI